MKTASSVLTALLNSAEIFRPADLYDFTLTNGTVLNYTSHDVNITISSTVYTPMLLTRGSIKSTRGIDTTSTLSIDISAGSEDLLYSSVPILHAMRRGDFDGAILKLHRVYNPNAWEYNNPPISVDYTLQDLFVGRVDVSEVTRQTAKLEVKSLTELLNIQLPRNVLLPSCTNTLYDSICSVSRSAFTTSNAVITTGSTVSLIRSGLTQADGYFDLGVIIFSSGLRRTIKSYSISEGIRLVLPLATAPTVGDLFDIYPGCDKLKTTCETKFNALANFRGFPFIPTPEVQM